MKNFKFIFTVFLILLLGLIALEPTKYIQAALNGLSAWTFNVLPALLPFMIISKIIISLQTLDGLNRFLTVPCQKLYGCDGQAGYVYFLSIMAGYPVGSKITADLYQAGKISRAQALRMSAFCSNSGPMFIIGTVGALLLGSVKIGFILFFSHILSALLNGIIYRKINKQQKDNAHHERNSEQIKGNFLLENNFLNKQTQEFSFGDIVSESVKSVLNVGGIICFFFIIIEALSPIFSILPSALVPLTEGAIELTRGCIDAVNLPINLGSIICSFLISFGGFSTIMQSMAMLKKVKMPVWLFSIMKLSQGIISALLTAVLLFIF